MSNFFDNFIGGLAFGMLANNPLFGGMCCYGFGGGYYSNVDIVDFGTFANPFPAIAGGNYVEQPSIFTTFANPFPTIDYSGVGKTIWDIATDPNSEYNKRMKEYYENLEKLKDAKTESKTYIPQIQYPFSSFYMPTQITMNPYVTGWMGQTTVRPESTAKQDNTGDKKTEEKSSKKASDSSKREFEAAYEKLGITDKRFQKMFEECILINEGRKPNEDIVIEKDVHSKNKNGVLQGSYDSYRDKKGLPHRDVAEMTAEEMCEIYYNDYYVNGGAADIKDDRLALYVFDSDVNMGVGTGKKILKKSGNDAEKFEAERRKEYSKRNNFSTYKNAWYNRINKTGKYADDNFSAIA